ncbi:MAG: gamma-glutamyltransferase, partial [Actinomycetota bacterium]|nr:gamma-glutamyltransferase [Actinomycetota bacterium]
ERGLAVGARTATFWTAEERCPAELGPAAPRVGERVAFPELARTLRAIADSGAAAVYRGPIARAIAEASWLDEDDLARYRPRWVEPLRGGYRGATVLELPPPTQGVAALEALGLLELGPPDLPSQVECVSLALADGLARVRDGADVRGLLDSGYVARRRAERASAPPLPVAGDTAYLCVVDSDRFAVSLITSLYGLFGSGVVAPGTGIVLQNRGACFVVEGRVAPGRRPYHTIIPGLLLRDGRLLGAFGVVGGFLQAQAHVQIVSALVDDGLDPQAALDRPRFRLERERVRLEEGLWEGEPELSERGWRVSCDESGVDFGAGQAILCEGDALVGGSDSRADGLVGIA